MVCLVYCDHSFLQRSTPKTSWLLFIILYASIRTNVDSFDDFWDISPNDKCLDRVGAKTFAQTGTFITIKLYKNDEEETFINRQGITLSTGDFESLADSYRKVNEKKKLRGD